MPVELDSINRKIMQLEIEKRLSKEKDTLSINRLEKIIEELSEAKAE